MNLQNTVGMMFFAFFSVGIIMFFIGFFWGERIFYIFKLLKYSVLRPRYLKKDQDWVQPRS